MGITPGQRLVALELLQKLVKTLKLEEFDKIWTTLNQQCQKTWYATKRKLGAYEIGIGAKPRVPCFTFFEHNKQQA